MERGAVSPNKGTISGSNGNHNRRSSELGKLFAMKLLIIYIKSMFNDAVS